MAETALRTRDHQPDIRARISINDESPINLKHQLEVADQTQRALRSQQPWHPSAYLPNSLHRAVLRKTRTSSSPSSFSSVPLSSDHLPYSCNRANSLTSLSTIQREAEAASLSLYRGSPISAISPPPCVAPTWAPSVSEYEPQDPCPPRPPFRVETLSQYRKNQKILAKSFKKKIKEQIKAEKEEEQLRRAALAADIAAARERDAAARGEALPLRTKGTRSIASQVVKRLTLKQPLSRLNRQVRKDRSNPPTLDDFDSKEQFREYLNPSPPPPPPSLGIAELPAELPEYTPFEDETRTKDNGPVKLLEDASPSKGTETSSAAKVDGTGIADTCQSTRSMRCDSCKSPIRLHQVYYHCSICEDGDRILCSSCDQAGWSCRHEITEKVRNVSRVAGSQHPDPESVKRDRTRFEAQYYAAAMLGLSIPDFSAGTGQWSEFVPRDTMSAVSPAVDGDTGDGENAAASGGPPSRETDDAKELAFQRREQDIVFREKEIALREREAALREQQATVREQEAQLSVKQQMFALELQSALTKQMDQLSLGVGTQFQDLSPADNIRNHATKRKAGGDQANVSPSQSRGSHQKIFPKPTPSDGRDPDDEDQETGGGTPKKIKQDPKAASSQALIFACPYAKFDKPRYSAQNFRETVYRCCSSKLLKDISRLKQHLYRVHEREIHCGRCYTIFAEPEELDEHLQRAEPCPVAACPFPEKFDSKQKAEIHTRRPNSTPEQVWYTIYGILFPGEPLPASPYADGDDVLSTPSPLSPETRDTMGVLGELFESRLNQHSAVSGQDWLRPSSEAREIIRQHLRASVIDLLAGVRPPCSPSTEHPSVDVSPTSALLSSASTQQSSSSWTPMSSIPPSPINGSGSVNRSASDTYYLLPGHRMSSSRPLSARTVPPIASPPSIQRVEDTITPDTGAMFQVPMMVDPENDSWDPQSDSWSHGDEVGLAISDFGSHCPSTLDALNQTHTMAVPPSAVEHHPVQQTSVEAIQPSTAPAAPPTGLKPMHSTTSSLDSGYGSLGGTSFSTSARPPEIPRQPARGLGKGKGKRKQDAKEPSPVPESAINFEALNTPYKEFAEGSIALGTEEYGNTGATNAFWLSGQQLPF